MTTWDIELGAVIVLVLSLWVWLGLQFRGLRSVEQQYEQIESRQIANRLSSEEATAEPDLGYDVAGKPARIPYRVRRQQLREASRTKREQQEQLREAM